MKAGEIIVPRITICLLMTLAVVMTVLGPFALERAGSGKNFDQTPEKIVISVTDPRPLARAISILEAKYGWTITYEDPPYLHADDIVDVTEQVRRDLHKFQKGAAPKVLIPKGGSLRFEYYLLSQHLPPDPKFVVHQLLNAQAAGETSGRFHAESSGEYIHVIPTAVKNRSGELMSQVSILNALISLPANDRSGLQSLEAICTAITRATRSRVILGSVPSRLFVQYRDQQGAETQPARDTLVQLLHRVGKEVKLSWQLFYDPGMRIYVLNIHVV